MNGTIRQWQWCGREGFRLYTRARNEWWWPLPPSMGGQVVEGDTAVGEFLFLLKNGNNDAKTKSQLLTILRAIYTVYTRTRVNLYSTPSSLQKCRSPPTRLTRWLGKRETMAVKGPTRKTRVITAHVYSNNSPSIQKNAKRRRCSFANYLYCYTHVRTTDV